VCEREREREREREEDMVGNDSEIRVCVLC
jgi:hypothetical protein